MAMARHHIARNRTLTTKADRSLIGPTGDFFAFISVRFKGVNIAIGAIYLENGIGPLGPNLLRLHALAEFLMALNMPWLIMGDFNFPPEDLEAIGYPHTVRGQILRPAGIEATCTSGEPRMLDYGMASNDLIPAVKRVYPV